MGNLISRKFHNWKNRLDEFINYPSQKKGVGNFDKLGDHDDDKGHRIIFKLGNLISLRFRNRSPYRWRYNLWVYWFCFSIVTDNSCKHLSGVRIFLTIFDLEFKLCIGRWGVK
jgi:hypothetical protein